MYFYDGKVSYLYFYDGKVSHIDLNVCTAHVLMRFCHLINRSFICKAKEGHHIRIPFIT